MAHQKYEKNKLIPNDGAWYPSILSGTRADEDFLRPVYEAFTNSLEAINDLNSENGDGEVIVQLFSAKDLNGDLKFDRIVVKDNGVGFNEENFRRLLMYKDTRKGHLNKGSGRFQLILFFNQCEYESTFQNESSFKTRSFVLSKRDAYLQNNAIVFYKDTVDSTVNQSGTTVTLKELIRESNKEFDELTAEELKEKLIDHYMMYFCSHKDQLPIIKIQHFDGDGLISEKTIAQEDIPDFDKEDRFTLFYSKLSYDSNDVVKTDKEEEFLLQSLKLNKSILKENTIRLTSKKEIVNNPKINLKYLLSDDHIDNNRYAFLLSSPYLDQKVDDTRGVIDIPTTTGFIKERDIFPREEILLDEIEETVNNRVLTLYSEINSKVEEHRQDLEELKAMFLLNETTVEHLSFGINDSEEKILKKVYAADSEITAKRDAEIKQKIDRLDELDPTSETYDENLKGVIDDLVRQIPLSNRTALTQYVARRKLVLELLDKILKKELNVQNDGSRNNNEALLHSLIFQQGSQHSEQSDLWVVNEDFIYFSGTSNVGLSSIEIDGVKLLKEELTDEEKVYRKSLDEDRFLKKPDILLFPAEGKCIIVEFKDLDTNVSAYLDQINRYASLIRNLAKNEFLFDTFYGYLIGEAVDGDDVRDHDGHFVHSPHFDYVFRPAMPIVGKFGRPDASLYTEVLKYSTLLARASKRNEIFLHKILKSGHDQ